MLSQNMIYGVIALVILIILVVVFILIKKEKYMYPDKVFVSVSTTSAGSTKITPLPTNSLALCTDSSGNIATTSVVPNGAIIMWGGAVSAIPTGWALCDGTNGTPDLRSRFVVGAAGDNVSGQLGNTGMTAYSPGLIGGEEAHTLATNEMPSHQHAISGAFSGINPAIPSGAKGAGGWFNSLPPDVTGFDHNKAAGAETSFPVDNLPGTSWVGGDPDNVTLPYKDSLNSFKVNQTVPHNNMPPFFSLAFIMKLV